jgi:putative peptide zinc metalloprotease protein
MYELKTIDEIAGRRYLLLDNCGGIYKISEVLYHMLCRYKLKPDYSLIAADMNNLYGTADFTVPFIEASINSTLTKISKKESSSFQTNNKYIKGKIVVLKEGQLQLVYKVLALLFYKKTFTCCSLAALATTFYFFYAHHLLSFGTIYQSSLGLMSVSNLAIVYGVFILIILVHEIGHASASYSFGVRPKEIGFGFYFVFPVFYTNVTDIWALKKEERNTVNIAGIYFQLLINVILIVFFYLHIFKVLVFTLILANTISVITSLIPFFRYDGYWLFSDYFDIPNLQNKARQFIIAMLRKPKYMFQQTSQNPRPLIIYSLLNILFWVYVYIVLLRYIITNFTILHHSLLDGNLTLTQITFKDIISTVTLVITTYLLLSQILITFKFLYNESSRVYRAKK